MRKHVVKSYKSFDAADISSNQTSAETSVLQLDSCSFKIDWSGATAVGEIKVQASNVPLGSATSSDWYDLDLGSTVTIDSAQGYLHHVIFTYLPFAAIRLSYVSTSGTGSLNATLTAKTIGA